MRNKIAHGKTFFEAIELCDVHLGENIVNQYNVVSFMDAVADEMTGVYNFFSDIYE